MDFLYLLIIVCAALLVIVLNYILVTHLIDVALQQEDIVTTEDMHAYIENLKGIIIRIRDTQNDTISGISRDLQILEKKLEEKKDSPKRRGRPPRGNTA